MDATRPVPLAQDPLWVRLSNYLIGPADAALSFARRLARENGWRTAHAERVLVEYRRFCYLAVRAGHEVTPSDAVDQAWHLHLTYSRDYWGRFCPDVLGMALHHGPTAGGSAEAVRYYEQYAETLKSYERLFGETPPADLWPSARRRFFLDPGARRVHPRDGLFLTWPRVALIAALLAGLVCAGVFLW
jgi:hypothetical protein